MLGQYEFPRARARSAGAAAVRRAEPRRTRPASLDADHDQLLRWVALHEITHALQFGGVPWLRAHLAEMVRELLGALELDPRGCSAAPRPSRSQNLVEQVREDGLAMVVVGPERREALDRVQAFMAVLEGYAEHVMDAVGVEVLDDLPALRTALQRRRRDRSGLLKLLERLIGMDLKLRQYEQGKAFCDGVVARAGIDGLNRVWDGPEAMPTMPSSTTPRAGSRAPSRRSCGARSSVPNLRSLSHKVRAVFTAVHVRRDRVPATKSGHTAVTRPGSGVRTYVRCELRRTQT